MESPDIPDEQLTWIYYHGAHPLWLYLKTLLDIDITEVCPRVAKDEPILNAKNGDLVARVVELPHDQKLRPEFNNDVIFLVNSINTVFEILKNGVERDGQLILKNYKFKLDEYNNLYLTENETPIGNIAIAALMLK
jgi:hypothetical protein